MTSWYSSDLENYIRELSDDELTELRKLRAERILEKVDELKIKYQKQYHIPVFLAVNQGVGKYGSIVKCIKSEMYKFESLNINRREQEF